MKVLIICLLALQAFMAGAATTNGSLNEISTNLDQQCGSYCYTLLRSLVQSGEKAKNDIEENAIAIRDKDNQIKVLEAKVAELQANLEFYKEKENQYEEQIKYDNDLVANISLKMDSIRNKVGQIAQINTNTNTTLQTK
ncbi:uncharacterized protein LOC115770088 [Drosophila novamexicana]|uniref:uncharacterized protein LOC115770088 n=1 Tax=Drosophila novamexicana TaxID=47314 RepID=UPI0011E5D146|nr:uncharacterized protein LOC115770088 [Drosophila novamexicana]